MFIKIFTKNGLIPQNQSGFKPGNSCINQPLSITHKIQQLFDEIFFRLMSVVYLLHISQVFVKVWHDVLVFKLKQNSISGNLLILLSNFLRNRKQRVFLKGQTTSWAELTKVPYQAHFFNIYIYIYIHIFNIYIYIYIYIIYVYIYIYINVKMILLIIFHQMQNYFQMTLLYFLLFIMQILQ